MLLLACRERERERESEREREDPCTGLNTLELTNPSEPRELCR